MKGSKQRAGLLSGVNSSIAIILHCGRQAVSTFVYRIFFNWSRSDSAPIKMPASGLFVYTRTLLCAFRIFHDATRNQATAMNKTIITNNGYHARLLQKNSSQLLPRRLTREAKAVAMKLCAK